MGPIFIGLPFGIHSVAVDTLKLKLNRYLALTLQRRELEQKTDQFLHDRDHYQRLRSMPGVGLTVAFMVIAE